MEKFEKKNSEIWKVEWNISGTILGKKKKLQKLLIFRFQLHQIILEMLFYINLRMENGKILKFLCSFFQRKCDSNLK